MRGLIAIILISASVLLCAQARADDYAPFAYVPIFSGQSTIVTKELMRVRRDPKMDVAVAKAKKKQHNKSYVEGFCDATRIASGSAFSSGDGFNDITFQDYGNGFTYHCKEVRRNEH